MRINSKSFFTFRYKHGIKSEATGIENIFIMGYLRGLSKNEIQNKINDIIEFAEIEKFSHLPCNTYSSGMKIRLATAIAINLDPKLLLIDEFFGAGDQNFLKNQERH